MACRRCTPCRADWPTETRYQTCPICGKGTVFLGSPKPMEPAEVRRRERELPAEVRREAEADWARLEREVARRGGHFTAADVLAEFGTDGIG